MFVVLHRHIAPAHCPCAWHCARSTRPLTIVPFILIPQHLILRHLILVQGRAGNAMPFAGPLAKINQSTTFRTKWSRSIFR